MKNWIVIGTVVFVLFSCTSNTIFKKPDGLISEETMADIISDIEIAIIAEHKKNLDGKYNIDYMPLVYEKYGVDSLQFANSSFYYNTDIDEYKKILALARTKLAEKKKVVDAEMKVLDSLKMEKQKRDNPIIKDSLPAKPLTPVQ